MKIIQPSVELIDNINPADIYNKIERCGRVSHQSESKGNPEDFIRKIIKLGHESVLEHVSLTFHIITDRAIQNELVRHRHASFTVESTRYVKYDELTFIEPDLWVGYEWDDDKNIRGKAQIQHSNWFEAVQSAENYYLYCLTGGEYYKGWGMPPEFARAVLPLCLKSELYMTANLRELRHILKLRTDKAAHPQMRFIAGQILQILRDKLPVIVEDIQPCGQ